jgi:hypothetical protein
MSASRPQNRSNICKPKTEQSIPPRAYRRRGFLDKTQMKYWGLILIAVALLCCVYIFIPQQLILSKVIIGNCNINTANRCFSDTSKWAKWFPKDNDSSDKSYAAGTGFIYNRFSYKITALLYNDVQVQMQYGDSLASSDFRIASLNKDSILIGWQCTIRTSNNPFRKVMQYQQAKHLKKNIDDILAAYKSYIEVTKNIYGADFHQTMSKDSTLVTMNSFTTNYPTTGQIYQLIDSLKSYVASEGAKEINYPMLNVSKSDKQFKTMVAISVDRELRGTSRIVIKRFVPWKMLEGQITGGVYSVDKAFEQLYKYRDDHLNSIMAIPFQSLITDRRKEPDTAKWITKICAPIS